MTLSPLFSNLHETAHLSLLNSPTQQQWFKIAKQTRRKINFGWTMEFVSLPLVISSILFSILILLLRRHWSLFDNHLAVICVSLTLLLLISFFAIRSRNKYESSSEILVRLESSMGLHSSLTAADQGKTSWPSIPENIKTGLQWKFRRLLTPLLGSVALLVLAFIFPIQTLEPTTPKSAPQAWQKLTAELEELKDKDIIDDAYIKEIEKKLNELKQQPEKDWFSHPSLEATEHLKKSHHKEIKKFSRNLDKAEKALTTLKKYSQQLTQAQKSKLLNQFNNAMKGIEKGNMKPNKELLEQLKKVNPEMLNNLTPEQMEQLKKNMQNMSDELKKQLRENLPESPGEGEQLGPDEGDGRGQAQNSENDPNSQPDSGTGSPHRGPGHEPKVLGGEAADLEAGRLKKLKAKDLKNSIPGDLLETSEGLEHDVDKSKTQQQSGGNSDNKGQGGDSVWENNYLPKEKRALKNFFK